MKKFRRYCREEAAAKRREGFAIINQAVGEYEKQTPKKENLIPIGEPYRGALPDIEKIRAIDWGHLPTVAAYANKLAQMKGSTYFVIKVLGRETYNVVPPNKLRTHFERQGYAYTVVHTTNQKRVGGIEAVASVRAMSS